MFWLKILGPLAFLAVIGGFVAWGKHGYAKYDQEHAKVVGLVSVTAEVAGIPKLKVKDAPGAIRKIGADRDTYLAALTKTKASLNSQTQLVVEMGEETAKLRAESARQAELVRKLAAQRDGWIRKAEAASTRTERKSFEEEARDCESAMDALYQAGF